MSPLLAIVFVISILGNVLFLQMLLLWVRKKDGIGYVLEQVGLRRTHFRPFDWQMEEVERHRLLPRDSGEVVLIGDSQVAGGEWSEYFSHIKNRGIGGDTTDGILNRLDDVLQVPPRELVLLVGTNDLARYVTVA